MADYSHLQQLEVTEETEREYVFDDIPGEPSIWFRHMGATNTAFLNERVRISAERAEKMVQQTKAQRKKQTISAAQLEEDRDIDRELMAKTCAIRWGTAPRDASGKTHEFSTEECYAFLKALPHYMFEPCRNWVQNVYNFVDRSKLAGGANDGGEALGNESPSD